MADWSSFDAQNPPGGATAAHMEKLSGITASAADINRATAQTISLVIDNSASTGTDPDFIFEGPAGDTVSVDWGDGFAETFTLLGYDPSGDWDNAVEATHTYSDGQDTHCVVITGTDLRLLDVLVLDFTRASGEVFPLDFRWLRGSGAYLELDLSGTNGIAPLVSGMTSLQVLSCTYDQLTALPDLSDLDSLQTLDCGQNQLTALPDLSGLDSLQGLYCGVNDLTVLPDLSGLTALRGLNCSYNQLTALPDLSGLDNLQSLTCSSNQLTALPDLSGLDSLQGLDCDHNQLTALPELSGLASLQGLHCDHNQLTALPELSGLASLVSLYCPYNQLTALPDLSGLTALQTVYCGNNQLTESAVNAVLAQCVAIETAVPGARTIYLDGGTNHAPTGQGITDAATLVTAGWTVFTN